MKLLTRLLGAVRRARYPGSLQYWERRYARGGHSGSGSSGRLAEYKAMWLNQFVLKHQIRSVVEFGCGDGQQLRLAAYPDYLGLDISSTAIERCRAQFGADPARRFAHYDPFRFDPAAAGADLAISLEVLFHLTEDDIYRLYLQHLFGAARHWVVIFASNTADDTGGRFPHFRPRHFTPDVPPGWALNAYAQNPHRDISVSDFFVFKKRP